MNKAATIKLIRSLNEGVLKGKLRREEVEHLKGGLGKCTVFTDKVKHPDSRVYSSGKIVMNRFSSIGYHKHEDDWEEYTVLAGKVQCGSRLYFPGETMVCKKGESHSCLNAADGESVLRFVKRK